MDELNALNSALEVDRSQPVFLIVQEHLKKKDALEKVIMVRKNKRTLC